MMHVGTNSRAAAAQSCGSCDGNAAQNISKPSERIDMIELCGLAAKIQLQHAEKTFDATVSFCILGKSILTTVVGFQTSCRPTVRHLLRKI
jgi:hypothetical protein